MNTQRFLGSLVFLCIGGASLFAQGRDFQAERVVIDDNAGDGGFNTATVQAPVTGLSANRTLTLPDADGSVVTALAPLAASQILFGGASGQAVQSASLVWNSGSNQLNVGAGNFTVFGATGNTVIAGTLDVGNELDMQNNRIFNIGAGNTAFTFAGGLNMGAELNMQNNRIFNIGAGNTAFTFAGGLNMGAELNMQNNRIFNIGAGNTAFTFAGGLNMGAELNMQNNRIFNIGAGNTAFTLAGGLNMGAELNMQTFRIANIGTGNTSFTLAGGINMGAGAVLNMNAQNINNSGNIVPAADATYDLGSNMFRWDELWVSGPTIHIGSSVDEAEVRFTGGNLEFDGNDDGTADVSIDGITGAVDIAGRLTTGPFTVANGHWTSTQTTSPTAAGDGTNVAAGVAVSASATDAAGLVTVTDGGNIGTGVITVTFDIAYAGDPVVTVTPANAATASSAFYVNNITANSFDINVVTTAGDGTTSYSFYYQVLENN